MTTPRAPAPPAGRVTPLAPARLRRVVAVLCFTEVVSWGVLFYAFPVLLATISRDQGWSLSSLVGTFTLAQVVGAVTGVWVGRRLDRHGPRVVMTLGSVLGVAAVTVVATAPTFTVFVLGWVLAGVAMSATLYPPAFATVTHWAGERRVRALTVITLVAGLASTVFAPLAAVLLSVTDWRGTFLLLAAVLAVTAPVHWWGLRDPWHTTPAPVTGPAGPGHQPGHQRGGGRVMRQPEFLFLTAALTLGGFCVYAVVVNLVPLLTGEGLTTTEAAVALGIGGLGQVAGRLLYAPLVARLPVRARTVAVLGAASATTALLALTAGSMTAASVASFAAGTARGIFTLIQATAVSDRWGTHAYGMRSGVLSGGVMTASAFAPWAGTLLAGATGGYVTAFLVLAAGAALSVLLVRPVPTPQDATSGLG